MHCRDIPHDYFTDEAFEFGKNVWDKNRGSDQSGFQVFKYKKDAVRFASPHDKICPVKIKTADIVKMSDEFSISKGYDAVAFEVTEFNISRKKWESIGK